ncbi:MAG TPA: alpha-galactosidase [Puia sp.]|nr:alpha-galactosidase [Puia sp.]
MKSKLSFFRNGILLSVLGIAPYCWTQSSQAQSAQPSPAQVIPVETAGNALVLEVNNNKDLTMTYLGKRLSAGDEYGQVPQAYRQPLEGAGLMDAAYTTSGSRNLLEPAITVTHADGNNSLDLRYVSHQSVKISDDISLLTIQLKDPVYDFEVTLYYKSYYKEDVIEQWSMIRHTEKGNVILHKFASANLYLKADSYWLRQYHGAWAKEMQPEESRLTHGIKTLDTKLGTRADLYQPPVFMVSLDRPAGEDEGTVLYGSMEWTGNFRIDLELDPLDNLKIIAGVNNYASPYTLAPNEAFTTPPFLYTLSDKGKGAASRKLQQWARNYRILDGKGSRLTLLNNWESTYFDFNETKLAELLKDTKKLGVDLFLLDDGWFGNKYPRNDDHAGLGDWQENKNKLPNSIASLVKEAQNDGVKFGIWIEPEMVNPKSELYGQHPDWVIKQPKREEAYFRNQLVLDLSNPRVQDFVYGIVDGLFTKNPDLAYIKWDCNAVIYNAYSAFLKDQSHFYIDYVRGLYKVLERIRAKYPKVPMMLCSGGGGRVDYAALKYFTEFWPSDNTDPMERIFIQWENSYFYPAVSSSNHVTDWGKQPLKFRTDVAMMGKLGFDVVVSRLNPPDLEYCQNAIKTYNTVKAIVWQGDQYRLSDPVTSSIASVLYLDSVKTSGVIFNYLVNNRYGAGSKLPIRLKGLDPAKKYRLSEIDLYPGTHSTIDAGKAYSGDFLMNIGFNPDVHAGRTSVVLKLEAI